MDIDIALASPDPFGQVTASRLTLSSRWCTVRLETTSPTATYVWWREGAVAYVRWAQTLFLGIDVSSRRFTLAFSNDAKEALCSIGPDGTISFSRWEMADGEGTPHDSNIYTGDVLKCFLDADFDPETFDVTGWGFELQHVKEDCYLIVKQYTSSVDRSEEEALGMEKELWRRIGLAQLGELPGKRRSIVPRKE